MGRKVLQPICLPTIVSAISEEVDENARVEQVRHDLTVEHDQDLLDLILAKMEA